MDLSSYSSGTQRSRRFRNTLQAQSHRWAPVQKSTIKCVNMLRRRDFLGLASSAALLQAQAGRRKSTKPNIVFIMADDLGYGEVSCYGEKRYSTPNIDRIAREGMKFTQAYAGCTVCAPSRSVLMTGLHTGHTAVRQIQAACRLPRMTLPLRRC